MANIPFLNNAYFAAKVGIGTDSPQDLLSLSSAAGTSRLSIINTDGGKTILQAGISGVSNNGTSFITANSNGASETVRMVISSAGNVGIGVTNPTFGLTVYSDEGIQVKGKTGTINGSIRLIPASGGREYQLRNVSADFQIRDISADVVRMHFDNDGNTGIGTTTPNTALQVNQATTVPLLIHRPSNTNFDPHGIGFSTRNDAANGGLGDVRSGIFSDYNGDLFLAASQSSITSNPLASSRLFIEGSNGNVGIGTTSPGTDLEIGNGTGSPGLTLNKAATGTASLFFDNGGNNKNWIKADAAESLIFGTNNSTNVTIKEGGNVGIGTTNPGGTLQVVGTYGALNVGDPSFGSALSYGGQQLYVNSSYLTLRTANVERLRILNGGNIGIGTAGPETDLMIYNTTDTSPAIPGATTTGMFSLNNSGQATLSIGKNSGNTYWISNVNRAFAGSYYDISLNPLGGNVGIGTTNPGAKLNVDGDVLIKSGEYLSWGTAGQTAIEGSTASNKLNFLTNGSSQMFLNSTGLGIGTTSPSTKLDVAGITRISESGNTAFYGGNYLRVFNSQVYTMRNSAGNQRFAFDNGSGDFSTYNSSNVRTSYLNNSGSSYLNGGNVGIGETNPGEKLHVIGKVLLNNGSSLYIDSQATQTIFANIANIPIRFRTNSASRLTIGGSGAIQFHNYNLANNTGTPTYILGTDATGNVVKVLGSDIPGLDDGPYLPLAGGTMTGNVIVPGIGVGNSTVYSNSINLNNLGTFRIGNAEFLAKSSNDLDIYQGRMRVTSAGNVGIGTTSPAHKLTVNAPNNTTAVGIDFPSAHFDFSANSTSGYTTSFHMDDTATTIGSNSAGRALIFQTNNIDRFYINGNTGNVGIGTTSPSEKLHVLSGNINMSAGYYLKAGNRTSIMLDRGSDARMVFDTLYQGASTGGYEFNTGSGTKFVIQGNGNVGIGTTSPGEKLEVIGTIKANSVKVVASTTTTELTTDQYVPIKVVNTGGYAHARINGIEVGGNTSASDEGYIKTQDNSRKLLLDTNGWKFSRTNTEFMRLTSDGKLGIGTTSPAEKLQVDGNIKISSTNGGNLQFRNGNTANSLFSNTYNIIGGSGSISDFNTYVYGNNPYSIWTNNTNRLTVLGNGNVGIGTTSPGAKLEVRKGGTIAAQGDTDLIVQDSTAASSTSQVQILGGATGFSNLYFSDTSAYNVGGFIYNHSSNYLATNVNGSEKMRITSAGNVGIGTTSPANKLQVTGGSIGVDSEYMLRDNRNNTILLQSANTAASNRSLTIGNATYSNIIIPNGNVGIGTTSPSEKLYVASTAGFIATFQSTTATDFRPIRWVNSAGQNVGFLGNNGSTNEFSLIAQDRPLRFGTGSGGAERMRITSAGNVGIGATSPDTLLNLEGVKNKSIITLGSTTNDSGWSVGDKIGGIDFYSADGSGAGSGVKGSISYIASTAGSGGVTAMTFSTASSASNNVERMRIDTSGNVGIGTTSPLRKLDIAVNAATDAARIKNTNSNGGGLSVFAANGGGGSNRILTLGDSSENVKVAVIENGNVGIGTTNPSATLHVDGSSGSTAIFRGATQSTINLQAGSTNNFLVGFAAGGFSFRPNGTTSTTMAANGNVGIGTTSPSQKLEVDGEVLSDGYRLSAMQTAPAARNSTGTLGEIIIDGDHLYVCYATNSWSRVALATAW